MTILSLLTPATTATEELPQAEILDLIRTFLEKHLGENYPSYFAPIILLLFIILLCLLSYLITKHVFLRILTRYIHQNKYDWDNVLLKRKVFHRLSHLLPAIILYSSATLFGALQPYIQRLGTIYLIVLITGAMDALLNAIDDLYTRKEAARKKPIKGYLQALKVFLFVIAGVVILSQLLNQSPILLLSGIGAMTAVIMLVFQDSILGLVAGIQLSTNDMVRIGDWIEMPKYQADGDVVEISLTTVKVENFDKTITTIPPHALVKDSFRNWRGMQEAGGRRIKRAINIDTSSITFCSDEMLQEYKKIDALKDYIAEKESEIDVFNNNRISTSDHVINGRRLTNIGTFRAYIVNYIRNHPGIHTNMIQLVRQLSPTEHGIPLELYIFTKTTNWSEYEQIQADIFDHLIAVAPTFGLSIFQTPGGHDLRQMAEQIKA